MSVLSTTPTLPGGGPDRVLQVYRAIAYVVGVFLPVLLVGAIYGVLTIHHVPVSTAAGRPLVEKVIGPIHGFLYIALLLCVLTIGLRERWNVVFLVLVGLSGTVPFLSFVAERQVTKQVRARRSAQQQDRDGAWADAATRPPTGR